MTRRWISRPFALRAVGGLLLLAALVAVLAWGMRERIDYASEPVTRRDVEVTVTAIGTLHPLRYVDVGAQVSGEIKRLHAGVGDAVTRGQLLVEIDPSVQQATVDAGRAALASLQAQLADQRAQHTLAARQLARQRALAPIGATREEDLNVAEAGFDSAVAKIAQLEAQIAQTRANQRADEARLGYTRIYAPMAGTLISLEAIEGQTLNATYQTPRLLRVADLGTMTVWTEVSEADVRRVRPGMAATFTTLGAQADERQWAGTVRQVLPAPPVRDPQATGGAAPAPATKAVTYTVLFDVANPDGELMPNMTAQVAFIAGRAARAIAVPLSAIQADEDRPGWYRARVLRADGHAETRALRVGLRSRHLAEVVEGLEEGERLITGETRLGGMPAWLTW
ncbi:efflux RND transporter periplasmic adaptor subunit [Hydrogenophaga sp. 2FB]|uniref:efflux RND transporter periplasmic adaptor subunit n=1 Tax=Hydrogenophaga sp. 2FB TaxID=2502187 RepID=UPI0010F55AC9|nr:efflux RND transporter periplasmic adaptor subunit [Hydrogenophaga sp. 2FB]